MTEEGEYTPPESATNEEQDAKRQNKRIITVYQRAVAGRADTDPEVAGARRLIRSYVEKGQIDPTWKTKGEGSWIEVYNNVDREDSPANLRAKENFASEVDFSKPLDSLENQAALKKLIEAQSSTLPETQHPPINERFQSSSPGPGYRLNLKDHVWNWTPDAYQEDLTRETQK